MKFYSLGPSPHIPGLGELDRLVLAARLGTAYLDDADDNAAACGTESAAGILVSREPAPEIQ